MYLERGCLARLKQFHIHSVVVVGWLVIKIRLRKVLGQALFFLEELFVLSKQFQFGGSFVIVVDEAHDRRATVVVVR